MSRFLLQRLGQGAVVLLGVTLITFLLVRITGNPAQVILGPDASPEQVERLTERMGLDRPLVVQYGNFLRTIAQGDFGNSYVHRRPAMTMVLERLPATLELAGAALLITLVISMPLGVLSAVRRDSLLDRIGALFVFGNQAMPVFWAGILGIMIFSVQLGWLPVSGRGTIKHLIMPAMVLGLHSAAYQTRLLRSAMLDILGQDYVRTARAKGLREFFVVNQHALRNALIPVVTATGIQFALLLGGAVITETVFAWPGVGSLAVSSISSRDIPVVMAATFTFAVMILAVNLLVDLSYGIIDPRIRLG
jgi:peptide/nickel transport system permease protein